MPNGREVVEAPPFRRVMPWVLIALGIAAFGFFAYERTRVSTTEKTTVREAASAGRRPVDKTVTTKEQTLSDATLVALLGGAAVLVLTGAFYGRVRKVTFAGQGVELDDSEAVAEAVAESALERLVADHRIDTSSVSDQELRDLLVGVATAAASVSQEVAMLRAAAAAAAPTRHVESTTLPAPGVPLAPGLLQRLSDRATREIAERERQEREQRDDETREAPTT
jgi:hypothetical protein